MIENIERVQAFVRDMSYDAFCKDERTVFASVTCFAIIGEAARLIPDEIKRVHAGIPWSQMTRMRNVLVHEYDRIDLGVVWRTIQEDLPSVLPLLRALVETR